MRKTIYTHPFLVKAEMPKGSPLGLKSRSSIRNSRFKTEEEALREKDILMQIATIVLVYNKKQCIFNSTIKTI